MIKVGKMVSSSMKFRSLLGRPIGVRMRTSSCGNSSKHFTTLVQEYERQVSEGKLLFDPLQLRAARKLTRLQTTLKEYDHASFLEQLDRYEIGNQRQQQETSDEQKKSQSISIPIPRGFYIHGNVGTGKSLLLNYFYNSAPTLAASKKRRLHFHSFLQDIHQRIHELNKQLLQEHGRSFAVNTSRERNPILRVAEQIAKEVTVLCIDEFQVTDVADAMILSQFFGELWRRGVVVVATSNRPPQGLYEGGLNRGYFLPFIDLLERYCLVHHLGDKQTEKDYRRIRSGVDILGAKANSYFYLNQEDGQYSSQKLDQLFHSFCGHHPINGNEQPLTLQVIFQRTVSVSRYHSNIVARFTFDELCTTELGSSDYRAVANHFQIVIIEHIPQLTLKYPDRARRFITLIDELYEAGCCLACSAVNTPDLLFDGKRSTNNHAAAQVQGSELASVKELSFAFARAASRLLEMCSETWWEEKNE